MAAKREGAEKADLYRGGSPLTHVSKDDPPFTIFHCIGDPVVPISRTEVFAAALENASVPVTVKTFPGNFHSDGVFWTKETMALVTEFFTDRLRR